MKKTVKRKKERAINWGKALARAKQLDDERDAARIVALVRELYHILIVKHGMDSIPSKKRKK